MKEGLVLHQSAVYNHTYIEKSIDFIKENKRSNKCQDVSAKAASSS